MKEPKDLGMKLGTKAQKFWTDFKEKTEDDMRNMKYQLEANNVLIELAEKRIAEEEAK